MTDNLHFSSRPTAAALDLSIFVIFYSSNIVIIFAKYCIVLYCIVSLYARILSYGPILMHLKVSHHEDRLAYLVGLFGGGLYSKGGIRFGFIQQ